MPKSQIETIRYIIAALVLIALGFILAVFYTNSSASKIPIIFSERDVLSSLWREYKTEYLEPGTFRTVDKQRDNVTTSEGQSYTMMRAVWMDDQQTFDASLRWAEDNLGRDEDSLFSWIFGLREDGTYGVMTDTGGDNSASDANSDIAIALVFAYATWGDSEYLEQARDIVRDMWEYEVLEIQGSPILLANDVEKSSGGEYAVVNPSYFSPYAYRIFAKLDPDNPWEELIDSSYEIIMETLEDPLDKETSAGIPPDWIFIHKETGEIKAPSENSGLGTNYSYDAFRAPWRIALDYKWFGEPRAEEALSRMQFLTDEWNKRGRLYDRYAHNGEVVSESESLAIYGGSIGQPLVIDPRAAREMYREKLIINYNPDTGAWNKNLSYYDTNWVWFGIALYSDNLPNLAATISDEVFENLQTSDTTE